MMVASTLAMANPASRTLATALRNNARLSASWYAGSVSGK
jgi:hypothetical protein